MSTQNCQLLLIDAGAPGFASRKAYGESDSVQVRDVATQTMLTVKAAEVSPYRHLLCADGKQFRILRVL